MVHGDRAYVLNVLAGTVAVINTATNSVIDSDPNVDGINHITVGAFPNDIVVSPNGTHLYVANTGDSTVSVIDAATFQLVDTRPNVDGITHIPVPEVRALAVSPVRVYGVSADGTVSVINTATHTVSTPITLARAGSVWRSAPMGSTYTSGISTTKVWCR